MGLALLDSSVLIALMNPSDIHHGSAIKSFDPTIIYITSAICITEVLPRAMKEKKGERFWSELGPYLREVVDIDTSLAIKAAEFRSKNGMRTPDAIISATAQERGAELWTFDSRLAKATPGARLLA